MAMGTGQSKKEAKHAAAKAVLDKMIVDAKEDGSGVGTNSTDPEVKIEIISPYDDKKQGNPIGKLQDMCVSQHWLPPRYKVVNEGLPHARLFTIVCIVFKHQETLRTLSITVSGLMLL
jgi:RISC-loading complex subunit TARBP2